MTHRNFVYLHVHFLIILSFTVSRKSGYCMTYTEHNLLLFAIISSVRRSCEGGI